MTTTGPPTRDVARSARTMGTGRRQSAGSRYRVLVTPLLLLAIALVTLATALTGKFSVRTVTVVGSNVPSAEIIAASGVQNHNIFTVRSDDVINRLAAIREVTVQRVDTQFPDSVTIYAQRRAAMVAWRRGTALYLVDRNGRVIKPVTSTPLPIISSTEPGPALSPGVVQAVRAAVVSLPGAPHGAIAGFTFDRNTGLTIAGTAGWRAIIGTGSPRAMITRVATLAAYLVKIKDEPSPPKVIHLNGPAPYASP